MKTIRFPVVRVKPCTGGKEFFLLETSQEAGERDTLDEARKDPRTVQGALAWSEVVWLANARSLSRTSLAS